jgi:hypothetical protein
VEKAVRLHMPEITISRLTFTSWITKTTDTHAYLKLNDFSRQKLLNKSTAMRRAYIACLAFGASSFALISFYFALFFAPVFSFSINY